MKSFYHYSIDRHDQCVVIVLHANTLTGIYNLYMTTWITIILSRWIGNSDTQATLDYDNFAPFHIQVYYGNTK